MYQSVFLFDYQRFQRDITPVLEALDRGDYAPLYEWYNRVVESMKPEDWILDDEDTCLGAFEPGETVDNYVLGYWLLVVLSTYLRRLPSPPANRPLFTAALYLADRELWHLMGGSSIASLIKPGSEASIPLTVSDSDPYWYWVRSYHGYDPSWLSLEQIRSAEQHLVSSHDLIMALDQKNFGKEMYGLRRIDKRERVARLHSAYDDALKMLQTALKEHVGFFLITS